MKIINLFFIISLSFLLLACHDNYSLSKHQTTQEINPTSKNKISKPTKTIDEQLKIIVKNDWRFEKSENIADDNLKLLDKSVSISFSKVTQPSQMTDPNYDINYQYYFSVDANCNQNSTVIGFDKTVNKVVKIQGVSLSTLVGCYPNIEQSLKSFIYNDNTTYQVDDEQISFTDDKNQTLFFKKKSE